MYNVFIPDTGRCKSWEGPKNQVADIIMHSTPTAGCHGKHKKSCNREMQASGNICLENVLRII